MPSENAEKPEEKKYKKLLNDLTENAELKHRMDKDYRDLNLNVVRQRREFYQNIILLSGIIIGLLASFGDKYVKNEAYFGIGIFVYFFLVILIYNYFREALDGEQNEIHHQQDILDVFLDKMLEVEAWNDQHLARSAQLPLAIGDIEEILGKYKLRETPNIQYLHEILEMEK